MTITYVTIEDVSSGLFRSQVIDLLKVIVSQRNVDFEVVVVNAPWRFYKHRKVIQGYKKELVNIDINIKYYPFLPPIRYSFKSKLYLKLIIAWLSAILRITIDGKTDLLHCRSYLATYCASQVVDKPVIFDMRSLWVLENISANNLVLESPVTQYWKFIEEQCLKRSYCATAVSKWMVEYSISIVENANVKLVPIGVDASKFFFDEDARDKLRKRLNIENRLVVVYSGSLGISGINKHALIDLVNALVLSNVDFTLLIISGESKNEIDQVISSTNLVLDRVVTVSPEHHEINNWLSVADIGIHALPKQLDTPSRLGTKVIEYWSNGMPTIVCENIGEAVRYINCYGNGYVYSNGSDQSGLEDFLKITNHRIMFQDSCAEVVNEKFNMKMIAVLYYICYSNALSDT